MKIIFIVLCLLFAVTTSSMTSVQLEPEQAIYSFVEQENKMEDIFVTSYSIIQRTGYNPRKEHLEIIYNKSIELQVDYLLIFALVAVESSFRQYAINVNSDNSKDFGYFQLNDRWHPQFKDDVEKHIEYGINFFKWCLEVEEDNIERALSRYNSGNPVSRYGLEYARRVLSRKREFEYLLHFQTLMR